ncbi:hypothetical protein HG536_0A01110 [Torulaspora globosa]|uniref:Uncharacterized protein n=1 Tax=Torulaspora globosa TaxID=48254 RepID=A0A7G3Z9V8_9SACH|nr:uncharacterized protein HG536_0A01110 [Torulaspora globosa]QLL30294.1 hypothetical protein HG536_0A01110 [Torulaspora globosa]
MAERKGGNSSGWMDESGEKSNGYAVVPVSLFCEQYAVSKEVRKTFGLYNNGVRAISRTEFEQLKVGLKSCMAKRQREADALWQSKKRYSLAESLEGNTLGSGYSLNGSHTLILSSDMLHSDLEPHYSASRQGGNEMLVSEDNEETGGRRLETQMQMLASSAGSIVSVPEGSACTRIDSKRCFILLSETSYDRNSSPPLHD